MRYFFFLLLLIVSSLFVACDDATQEKKQLAFSVQSDFQSDVVKIFVDGRLILEETALTNPSIGADLTAHVSIERAVGNHNLKIVVNDSHELATSVDLESNLYVGVNYNRDTHEISLVQSAYPFVYD